MLDCICITDRLGDDVEAEAIVYTAYNVTILHICSASEEGKKKGKNSNRFYILEKSLVEHWYCLYSKIAFSFNRKHKANICRLTKSDFHSLVMKHR